MLMFFLFRVLRTILTHSILWRKTKNLILWPLLTITTVMTDIHTYIHTDMATLWPTRPRGPSWWKKDMSPKCFHYATLVNYAALLKILQVLVCPGIPWPKFLVGLSEYTSPRSCNFRARRKENSSVGCSDLHVCSSLAASWQGRANLKRTHPDLSSLSPAVTSPFR